MTQKSKMTLYAIGALLMALPGPFTTSTRLLSLACIGVGYSLLIIATVRCGFTKPKTALLLLIISNLSFWFSVGLWLVRDRYVGSPPPYTGIDPFVGPLLLWMVVLVTSVIYEVVVFLRGVVANRDRSVAAVGLVAVVVQMALTVRSIYLMIQGV
jgi:hypothetical protein